MLSALELSRLQNKFDVNRLPKPGALSRAQELLIRDFIDTNFSLNPSLDKLASLVGLSRFHLPGRSR